MSLQKLGTNLIVMIMVIMVGMVVGTLMEIIIALGHSAYQQQISKIILKLTTILISIVSGEVPREVLKATARASGSRPRGGGRLLPSTIGNSTPSLLTIILMKRQVRFLFYFQVQLT
jgi:hypothetical protein